MNKEIATKVFESLASGIRLDVWRLLVKAGLEGQVVSAAQRWSFLYGLGAIALSLGMGWLAGRLFARA